MKYLTKLLISITLVILALTTVTSCANLGDGKFNPELSPNFGNGRIDIGSLSIDYIPIVKDAALLAQVFAPDAASSLLELLTQVRGKVTDTSSYSTSEAVALVQSYVVSECGIWCSLTSTQDIIAGFFGELEKLEAVEANQVAAPLTDFLDVYIDALSEAQLVGAGT